MNINLYKQQPLIKKEIINKKLLECKKIKLNFYYPNQIQIDNEIFEFKEDFYDIIINIQEYLLRNNNLKNVELYLDEFNMFVYKNKISPSINTLKMNEIKTVYINILNNIKYLEFEWFDTTQITILSILPKSIKFIVINDGGHYLVSTRKRVNYKIYLKRFYIAKINFSSKRKNEIYLNKRNYIVYLYFYYFR